MNLSIQGETRLETVNVGLGQWVLGSAGPGEWVIYGLGSCVGLILCDPEEKVAAMAHVVLPQSPVPAPPEPAKYADTAVPFLLSGLRELGASDRRIVAQIAGGAKMLQMAAIGDIGRRNVEQVRLALRLAGIPIVAECVGGASGRTLRWDRGRGIAAVSQVARAETILTPEPFRFVGKA